jgi:2-(1,2-epoxy-1,2-dihydrophenyl)acetyl-CoA isomerase
MSIRTDSNADSEADHHGAAAFGRTYGRLTPRNALRRSGYFCAGNGNFGQVCARRLLRAVALGVLSRPAGRPKMPADGGYEMPGVKRERDDSVGVLTLDEPETLNAMTPDLLGDLATAIGEINDDPRVRALVLTGAGRGFCSGQNLKAAQILGDDIAAGVMKYYWPAFKALRECRVPIVVAVNGVAAGGGFSLAMAGDMIVAARSARFIQVFSRIALVPDLGSTWLLPRLVGRQRALELMMTNEPLTADQAKEWGLVREVFDDTALRDGALTLARKLASGPTRALVATRRLIDESEHASYADQFRREIETQAQIRLGADAVEGRNAFLEKRAAVFTGR